MTILELRTDKIGLRVANTDDILKICKLVVEHSQYFDEGTVKRASHLIEDINTGRKTNTNSRWPLYTTLYKNYSYGFTFTRNPSGLKRHKYEIIETSIV